jgi:hypothetical protein
VALEALAGSHACVVESACEEEVTLNGASTNLGATANGATIAVLRSESGEVAESLAAPAALSDFEENAIASNEVMTVNDHAIAQVISEFSDSDQELDAPSETCAETEVSNPRHTRISMVM